MSAPADKLQKPMFNPHQRSLVGVEHAGRDKMRGIDLERLIVVVVVVVGEPLNQIP